MLPERFLVTPKGYRFDRYLYLGLCAVVVALSCAYVYFYGLGLNNHVYLNCPADTKEGWCANPVYVGGLLPDGRVNVIDERVFKAVPVEIANMERLPAGFTYGRPPPGFGDFSVIVMFLLLLTMVLNHFLHNGGLREESY